MLHSLGLSQLVSHLRSTGMAESSNCSPACKRRSFLQPVEGRLCQMSSIIRFVGGDGHPRFVGQTTSSRTVTMLLQVLARALRTQAAAAPLTTLRRATEAPQLTSLRSVLFWLTGLRLWLGLQSRESALKLVVSAGFLVRYRNPCLPRRGTRTRSAILGYQRT